MSVRVWRGMGLSRLDCYLVGCNLVGGGLEFWVGFHVRGGWIGFRGGYG